MKRFFSLTAVAVIGMLMFACQKIDNNEMASADYSELAGDRNAETGQGIMVDFDVTDAIITETVTYTFDKDAAAALYTTVVTGPDVVQTQGTASPAPPAPPAPAAKPINPGVVNQNKCVFFSGGQPSGDVYTQDETISTGNGPNRKVWKYTWTYTVSCPAVVAETAWTSEVTIEGVDPVIPINVTLAGLSALSSKQHPLKYSFDLGTAELPRIQDLKLTVDGVDYFPSHSIISGTDFYYKTNAGSSGNTSLLADGWASALLLGDSFAGNNGASSIVCAKTAEIAPTLGAGAHTITLTCTVKGNSGAGDASVNVTKNITIDGGCN